MMRSVFVPIFLALVGLVGIALADVTDAGTTESIKGCTETIPSGAARPRITDTFPARGLSGYAMTLVVKVEHGKGERLLPNGLDLQQNSDAAKALKSEGWVFPDQDGGGAAKLSSRPVGDATESTLELPLLALPNKSGRHELALPPLPIAMARASGEVAVVCTAPHVIVIEDPTSSTPDARPVGNPRARVQREDWAALRTALLVIVLTLAIAGVVWFFVLLWLRRPRRVPPPPPPRPPWEVALERLDEVRHAGLLETARFSEYFDRVSDTIRAYLGARFGFDGLESTTDEILAHMKGSHLAGVALIEIASFLQTCDLVKFANVTPTAAECTSALDGGEQIVRKTMVAHPVFVAEDHSEVRS